MGQTKELRTLLRKADVDSISAAIEAFLTEQGLRKGEVLRLRLTMEELLLRIRDIRGRDTECILRLGERSGRLWMQLSYAGAPLDPTAKFRESDGEAWSARLLTDLGVVPVWSWRRGINRLQLQPAAVSRNRIARYGAAIGLAVLLGLAGNASDPRYPEAAVGLILTPLVDLFLRAMRTFAGVTIFFSVVTRVCGIGDTSTFGTIGKLVLRRFIGRTLLWSAIGATALASVSFWSDRGKAVPAGAQHDTVAAMLSGIVPSDPISPFLEADPVQIVFLAVLTGLALLSLGDRSRSVRDLAGQCDLVTAAIMDRICSLAPSFVCIVLLRDIWSGHPVPFSQMWRPLAVCMLGGPIVLAVKLLTTGLSLKIGALKLAKLVMPVCRLAFRTSSPAAVFGPSMDECERELGIAHELVLLSLPIGNVLCAPVSALCCGALMVCMARQGAVAMDGKRLIALILLDAVLCLAIPPIPGAFLIGASMISTRLGIPIEWSAAMVAPIVLFDVSGPANSVAYLQLELLSQAKKLGLLNERILRRQK